MARKRCTILGYNPLKGMMPKIYLLTKIE
uniref:Uncharacterized protein n=1 Tax=Rhizophora mucronata TaxID=61149 RepID=A0A2P2MGT1_RHIMU